MKKNIISKVILASAFALALVSCSQEFKYEPAAAEDLSKSTYVGADINAARYLEIAGEDIAISFVRNNKEGALDVNLAIEDTSNIFSLKSPTITFADGDSATTAYVKYDYDKLDMKYTYGFTVSITDKDVISSYMPSTFPLTCIKAWQNLGIAQFYDQWWLDALCEKTLLKSPDGSDTYRLVEPWNEEEVAETGYLTFTEQMPYLEFSVDSKGNITYGPKIDLGFTFNGKTCHNWYPGLVGSMAADATKNVMVMDKVAQFCWIPLMNSGASWWGQTAYAWISFPGGPDLAELLEL